MKPILFALASLTALAACNSGKDVDLKDASLEEVAKAAKDAQKLEPGQWKTTVEVVSVDFPGMPASEKAMAQSVLGGMKGKKNTSEYCLTREEAEKPPAKMLGGDGQCTFAKFQLSAGRIDAKMTCAPKGQPGKMEITQTGSFGGTSYAIDSEAVMSGITGAPGGAGMVLKAKVVGARVGECKKA